MNNATKKLTLRERKKAQPNAVLFLSDAEKITIKETIGRNLNDSQYKIFIYTCQALGLNPLLNEIAAVTYKNQQGGRDLSIQVMRDGFLTIAHRSGKFAGLESGVKMSDDGNRILYGWSKVYHKDFQVPVYQEADFEEYNAPLRNALWKSKPKTMIKKVAESMALRKAFNINGVYAPEEMDKEEIQVVEERKALEVPGGDRPATKDQLETIKLLDPKNKWITGENKPTKQEAAEEIRSLSVKK